MVNRHWLNASAFIGMAPAVVRMLMKIQFQHHKPKQDTLNGIVIQPGVNALRVM